MPRLDRRAYLTALSAAAAAVSGCSEGDSTETPTDTAEPTAATATPQTPTEPDPTPEVTDAGLLLERGEYGALDDDISSIGQGSLLVVGTAYELPVSDGAARRLVETRVSQGDGAPLDTETTEVRTVAAGDSVSGQAWFTFDTADWDRGGYTAEVLVNDDDSGTTAATAVPFEVVEPLGPGEVEMRLAEFPSDVVAGEAFDWALGFRNRTDRDSSIVTDTVTITPAGGEPVESDRVFRENIPAGEEILVETEGTRVEYPGSYTLRIDEIDAEVSFTISEPE